MYRFCECCDNRLYSYEYTYCNDCVWTHGRYFVDGCPIYEESLYYWRS